MVRLRRILFCFVVFALGSGASAGAETPIGGQVVGPDGQGLKGVRVGLEPIPPDYQRVAIRLGGDVGPGAEVEATTDGDGFFQLLAPRLGAWKVVVPWSDDAATSGTSQRYVTEELVLSPLSEPSELPPVELRPASQLEIRVLDEEGRPVEARLGLSGRRRSRDGWRPRLRLAHTGADGTARLPYDPGEEPRLEVLGPSHPLIIASGDELTAAAGPAELRLPSGVAGTAVVSDRRGSRVAGAVAYQGPGILPLGRTDDEGRLRLFVAPPEHEPPTVSFLTDDGYVGSFEPRFSPDQANDAEVVLAPLRRVRGRVIDRDSRDPVAGALVWAPGGPVAQSDARGGYELRLFPSRRLVVEAVAEGYAAVIEQTELERADSEDGPTLALPPAATVRGTVVDSEGTALAGVDIGVASIGNVMTRSFSSFRRGGLPSTRSTRRGEFLLSGLPPSSSYELRFRKPGFAPARHKVEGLEAFEQRSGLRVVLESGASALGWVIDESEAPVAGAVVRLVPAESGDPRRALSRPRFPGSGEDERLSSSTDAEGRFRLAHLASGRYDLEVEAAGFAPVTIPGLTVGARAGATDLGTVVLKAGARIEGVVRDTLGAAVAEAEIHLGRTNAPLFLGRAEPATRSDAAGRFVVADLEAGEKYSVVVAKSGYGTETANAVAGTDDKVEVVLRGAGAISGRVRNEDGEPVRGAFVRADPPPEMMRRVVAASRDFTRTDDEGAFRLASVEPGKVQLMVSAQGYQTYQVRDLTVAPKGELNGLEIVLVRGATILGTVTRRDGTPVVEAAVSCSPARESSLYRGGLAHGQTDGDGRYRLNGVPQGPAMIIVQLGHRQVSKSIDVAAGTQTVDLVVDDGFEVSGRVIDTAGHPVPGAGLTLAATESGQRRIFMPSSEAAVSGSDGSFTLQDVAAGHYLLTAAKEGYAQASTPEPFEVAGSVAGIELELTRGATLRGRILGLEEEDLGDVAVQAVGGGMVSIGVQQGIVDFEGSYTVPHLGPGSWNVTARLGDTGRQASGQLTVAAGETEVVLDLEFRSGFSVDGLVVAGGQPQAGLHVFAGSLEPSLAGTNAQAVTDSNGRFRLSQLPAGKYRLMVSHRSTPRIQEIEVPVAGEVVIDLGILLRISGHVRDQAGEKPMPGAMLRLERVDTEPGNLLSAYLSQSDVGTDSRGYFTLEVGEGIWRVIATKGGYGPAEITVEVRAGGRYDDVELRLTPTESVTFEVLEESGAVPSQVFAAVLDAGERAIVRGPVTVGEGGTVLLTTVPAGTWDLAVQAGDSAVVRIPITAPGYVGQIVLPRAGDLWLKIPALEGEQDPSLESLARVALTGPGGRPLFLPQGMVGPAGQWPVWNGQARIRGLRPGVWKFTITHPDGRLWTGEASVSGGETTEVVVP